MMRIHKESLNLKSESSWQMLRVKKKENSRLDTLVHVNQDRADTPLSCDPQGGPLVPAGDIDAAPVCFKM